MRLADSALLQFYSLVFVVHTAALEADWERIQGSVREVIEKAERKFGKQPYPSEPAR
jgi:hypothetical protein